MIIHSVYSGSPESSLLRPPELVCSVLTEQPFLTPCQCREFLIWRLILTVLVKKVEIMKYKVVVCDVESNI